MKKDWCENRIDQDALRVLRFSVVRASVPLFSFRETAIKWARENNIVGEMSDAETGGTKAYAYHVTQIEVLAGTIGNDLSDTTPNANTPITNQPEANPDLTADSLLHGVCDVKGVRLLS